MFGKGSRLFAMTATLSFVGYCIYYDRKRRLDPQYKFKVHQRRLGEESILETIQENFTQNPCKAMREESKVEYVAAPLNILDKYNKLDPALYYRARNTTEQLRDFNRVRMEGLTFRVKCQMVKYLLRHVYLGENYLRCGQYNRSLRHFVYSVLICADPGVLFVKMHHILPNSLFCAILHTVEEYMESNGEVLFNNESSESESDDLNVNGN